jgi:nucleoside-diphosphate-sugar epimerase
MGITGKVGGATAEHLLAHGKEVRALVRNREKAANWANQGVEQMAIGTMRQPSSKRSKASKARSSCCRPSGRPHPITKKQRA